MDVYLPARCHWHHTDVAITVFVGISAYMTMVMVVVVHGHFELKDWRTATLRHGCRKNSWDRELRKKYNQQKRKDEFLNHLDLL